MLQSRISSRRTRNKRTDRFSEVSSTIIWCLGWSAIHTAMILRATVAGRVLRAVLAPNQQLACRLSCTKTGQDFSQAVNELNAEMDEIFGAPGGGGENHPSPRHTHASSARSGTASYSEAMNQASRLVQQQQTWTTSMPNTESEASTAYKHGSTPPTEPPGATGEHQAGKSHQAPVVQVFNAPVTLTQHFHVSARDETPAPDTADRQ
jgi:hypothetical protein